MTQGFRGRVVLSLVLVPGLGGSHYLRVSTACVSLRAVHAARQGA